MASRGVVSAVLVAFGTRRRKQGVLIGGGLLAVIVFGVGLLWISLGSSPDPSSESGAGFISDVVDGRLTSLGLVPVERPAPDGGEVRWEHEIDVLEVIPLLAAASPKAVFVVLIGVEGPVSISAFERASGDGLWDLDLHRVLGLENPEPYQILAMEGVVLVGFLDEDGRIAALDAADGTVLWEMPTVGVMVPRPPGQLIVGEDGFGSTGIVDARTGKVLWERYAQRIAMWEDRIAVLDGGALELLRAHDGRALWEISVGGDAWDVLVGDDMVVVGRGESIAAFDADTGEELWEQRWGDRWVTVPPRLVPLGELIGVSADGGLRAFGPDGQERWRRGRVGRVKAILAAGGEIRVLVHDERRLSLVDGATGEELGSVDAGEIPYIEHLQADGSTIVLVDDERLDAYSTADLVELWRWDLDEWGYVMPVDGGYLELEASGHLAFRE